MIDQPQWEAVSDGCLRVMCCCYWECRESRVLSTLLTALVTERFSFRIRRQIYEKILHSGWREVTAYHTGDLMTRLTSDAGNVADGIVGTIPNILQLGIELVLVVLYVVLLFPAPCGVLPCWWHRWQPCAPGGWENA